jgi:hypothetical protein
MDQPIAKKPGGKTSVWGTLALLVPLLAILAGAGWLAARTWIAADGSPISTDGYIAMTLGVGFSLALGCGLMALLFYSSRHGYDDIGSGEPYRSDDERGR